MRAHFADKHTDVDRCGIMSSTCLAKQPRISISRPQTLRVEHTVRIGLSPLSPDILAMVDQGLRELGATPTLRDDSGRHDVLWSIAAAAQQAVAADGAGSGLSCSGVGEPAPQLNVMYVRRIGTCQA